MKGNLWKRKFKVAIIFFLLGWYTYIIYPSWYLPVSPSLKLLYLNVVLIILFILTGILHLLLTKHPGEESGPEVETTMSESYFPYLIISFLYLLLHMWQINYPVLTGLDSQLHTGLPAVLLFKANQLILNHTQGYLSIYLLSWLLLLSIIVFVWRGKKWIARIKTLRLGGKSFIVIFILVIALSNLYAMALIKSGILERLGNISLIHRYPALGKSLFFAGYSLLGIREWVGRLINIGFTFAGGILLAKISRFYLKDKMLSLAVYALYIFLPPLLNVIWLNYLTAGTLFFFIAIHFYFLRYRHSNSIKDLGILIILLSAGFMYKRIVLASVFMLWTYALLVPTERRESIRRRVKSVLRMTAIPLLFFLPYLASGFWMGSSPKSFLDIERIYDPAKFIINFLVIPFVITKPVFFIFSVALIFILFRLREPIARLFLLWFLTYYIFSSSAAFTYQRNMLPFFPAVVLIISIFIYHLAERLKKWGRYFFSAACLIILALFLHLALFKEDTDLVTLSNAKYYLLPYAETLEYVKEHSVPGEGIYAPMITEPSQFYLAKDGIIDKVRYFRKIWADTDQQTLDSLYEFCRRNDFRLVIFPHPQPERLTSFRKFHLEYRRLGLPQSGYPGGNWLQGRIKDSLVEKIFRGDDPRFKVVKKFKRGVTELGIFRVVGKNEKGEGT